MWDPQVHSPNTHTHKLKWHIQISTKWIFKENEQIRKKIKTEWKRKEKININKGNMGFCVYKCKYIKEKALL